MLVTFTLLLSLLTPVFASKLAGPYQTMYYWYAYRLDIKANGVNPDMIAPGCPGSAPDGTCYFLEFVDHLQRPGKNLDPGQSVSFGKDFYPDAVTGIGEINKLTSEGGKPFVPNADPQKIFKSGTFTSPSPKLSDIMGKVTDKIQGARTKLGDAAVQDGLDQARRAMTGTHQARLADNGQDLIDSINNYLKNKKKRTTKVDTKTVTALDGSKFIDVDVPGTTAKDANFAQDFSDFQQWLSTQKGGKTTLGSVRMHWDAAQGVAQLEARVHGTPSC
ncbi:hypothetical protein F4808DRAFT_476033, partial [Astrocystis sublimbata]